MLPLAERMRPKTLNEYIGQKHLVGEGAILRQMIESGNIASFILWGPPGVGKTTLARIIAHQLQRPFYTLSAVTSGVKEVRDVIDKAKRTTAMNSGLFTPVDGRSPILFIDEIHRFSKSQQDSLLGAVEEGTITLIGATTENPSFEVITPLLSRCQVYVLKSLEKADLLELLHRALTEDEYIRSLGLEIEETESILRYSGGDARKLLNIIELVSNSGVKVINNETVTKQLQQNPVAYDKDGEMHPNAMLIANACFDVLTKIGWPEGRIPLAEATIYLATSPKSNSGILAIDEALRTVRETGNLPVPLHLRNAPTQLMKELGYSGGYKYAHDYPNHFVKQQFMPDELQGTTFWQAQGSPQEQKLAEWMRKLWGN